MRPALHVEDQARRTRRGRGRRPARRASSAARAAAGRPRRRPRRTRCSAALEPRHQRERRHAGEAAGEVDGVGAQRRQRGHLARHALRQRGEERRDADEQHRQQQRGLDGRHRVARAAGEVDAARRVDRGPRGGRSRHDRDDGQLQRADTRRRASGALRPSSAPMPMPRNDGEQDEVREVREQADLRRQPPDEGDFEEQDQERGQEDAQRCREHPGIVMGSEPNSLDRPGIGI